MSLACQFDQLINSYPLGQLTKEILVETKLKIPDATPKIEGITGGGFQIGSPVMDVSDGLLLISGVIYPYLLYVSDEPGARTGKPPHHQIETRDENEDHNGNSDSTRESKEYSYSWSGDNGLLFEERLNIPGLQPDSVIEVKIVPKSSDFERNGSDWINFSAKMDLIIHPTNKRQTIIITDLSVQPVDKVNISKESITTEELVAVKRAVIPVRASLQLPSLKPGIARVLNCIAKPSGLNWEYNRGKIYLKGLLDIGLVYAGLDDDDIPTELFSNEWNRDLDNAISFETYFETDLPEQGILVVPDVSVIDTSIEIKSRREMRCQVNLECQVAISRVLPWEIITEATPNPGMSIDTQKTLLSFEEYLGEANGEIPFELTVDLPPGQPGAERLLTHRGLLVEPKVEAAEGNVTVEGNLDLWVLYVADGPDRSRLQLARWESRSNNSLPISGMVDFPNLQPNSYLRPQITLESCKLELISDRTIKVAGQVRVRVLARTPRTISILEDCAEVIPVNPETRPSMLFYIVQPGDTLWKIARRYQTTTVQLLQSNQISNPDRIEIGRKLLIPKQIINL
jgi:hypothetical protein